MRRERIDGSAESMNRRGPLATIGIEPATLIDVLRWRSSSQSEDTAYTFLTDGDRGETSISYADLDRRARAIAVRLQRVGAKCGARALLLYHPSLEYIAAFLGCLYAGVVAVPAYPPRWSRPVDRLRSIISDSGASVALTDARVLAGLERRFEHAPEMKSLTWLATDDVMEGEQEWSHPGVEACSLAFLQYTSGSTAVPKGVMVSHENLLHNSDAIYRRLGHTPQSHMVSWLPPYHDMGLIGVILQSLYGGFPATLMPPVSFLQRPLNWLRVISNLGADSAGGPNFAYDLCARRVTPEERSTLDLSAWRVAFCGAEPIRYETLDRFAKTFETCGFHREAFYPGYGLAEATLFASGGASESPPVTLSLDAPELERNRIVAQPEPTHAKVRTLVGCGQTLDGQRITVVDPETMLECPSDGVGEIWVSGPSVAAGYWGQEEETERTFRAHLASTGEGPFLRTGDLGFLNSGELFVTGRLKDLIVLRGRNHYPQDIERTVEQSHEALRLGGCAAFSVESEGEERLVVVGELERRFVRSPDLDDVISCIRRAVAADHELEIYAIVLIRTGSLPVTSSGKVQRQATRRMYSEGGLAVVTTDVLPIMFFDYGTNGTSFELGEEAGGLRESPIPVASSVGSEDKSDLLAVLSSVRGFVTRRGYTEPIQPGDSLRTDLGLDSLALAELAVELERTFDVRLAESLVADVESVGDLCTAVLADDRDEAKGPPPVGFSGLQEQLGREIPQLGAVVTEQQGRHVKVEGRWCSDFASANYLGLDLHPEVIASIPAAIEKWGVHPSWTRAVASPQIYEDLERELAGFVNARHVLAFPTVTLLHSGVLPVLAGGDGVVLLDSASHNSMQEAAQLARSQGTTVDWFEHNDPQALERMLERYGRFARKIVAIDGVYSMSGAYPPLAEFARLARKHEARLYIDDAHGLGVVGERPGSRNPYGERGNGIVRHFGLRYGDEIVYVGGMSKAFSSMVAFVTCKDEAEKRRLAAASTSVFSGPSPTASLASALAGLKVSQSEEGEEIRSRLLHLTRDLIEGARELGFVVDNRTLFPLVNVEIGSVSSVIRACNILWEHGILITPALFPAVPIDRGGLRFTVTAANTEEQVQTVLKALQQVTEPTAVK